MSNRRPSFYEMGPPDPINYLRGTMMPFADQNESFEEGEEEQGSSLARDDMRRLDSDDEGYGILSAHEKDDDDDDEKDGREIKTKQRSDSRTESKSRHHPHHLPEEPPARERPSDGKAWPYRETLSFTRSLVFYGAGSITAESEQACAHIQRCRSMRQTYQGSKGTIIKGGDILMAQDVTFRIGHEGVAEIYHSSLPNENIVAVPSIEEFSKDYNNLVELVSDGAMRSFCFQRLQMLSTSFKMHTTINRTIEQEEQNNLLGTDFYRTLKIDNHIHAAAAPSAKQFVEFVRRKLESEGDTVVNKDGQTLSEVFKQAGIDKDHLTIDAFNVLADYSVYQRFDNFNRYGQHRKMIFFRLHHIHFWLTIFVCIFIFTIL